MLLSIHGSESAGNLYTLQAKSECLIIEAGLRLQVLKQALNYDLSNVVGALQSHKHLDHAKYIKDFMSAGIECYTSQDVIESQSLYGHRAHQITPMVPFKLGSFTLLAFPVPHGDCPNLGFLISHAESGKILFVTDASHIANKFVGLSHLMIEANYDDPLLQSDRTVGKHMSIDTCLQFLRTNDLRHVRNIVLLHLSASNSDSKQFTKSVQDIAPNAVITIADKGVEVNLNINRF